MFNKKSLILFLGVLGAAPIEAANLRTIENAEGGYERNLKVAKSECTLMVSLDLKIPGAELGDDHTEESFQCMLDSSDTNGQANQILPIRASIAQLSKMKDMLNKGELRPGKSTLNHGGAVFGKDGLFIPPGLNIASAVRNNGNGNDKNNSRSLQGDVFGDKPILVVKVIDVNGKQRPETVAQIGDDIFGTINDPVNLKSQMKACSFDKLNIIPGTYSPTKIPAGEPSAPGVIQINISIALDGGDDSYTIHNAVTAAVQTKLGHSLPGPYEQVMYVLEKCYTGCGWAAYAYINSWMSVYQAHYYKLVGVQMHELGHSFGLAHSGGLDSQTYTDHTCMMGNPLYSDDVGKMCFNAAKTWQLGWYNNKRIPVNPLVNSDTSVTMVGVADYAVAGNNRYVVAKIETGTSLDLFVAFNRATGINSQNDEADDQVTIVETGNNGESYSQSFLKATLLQGQSYVVTNFAGSGEDLTITATSIALSNTAGASQAVVNIKLGENVPPTKSPTKAPTDTPVAAPSKSPTKAPTDTPVAAPSKSPTKAPTDTPVAAPSKSPTKAPTDTPVAAPSKSPTKAPTDTPVAAPSKSPTKAPTDTPVAAPSKSPTKAPTDTPVAAPSKSPTKAPDGTPVAVPTTKSPTRAPTDTPVAVPSKSPTRAPTDTPVAAPSKSPTRAPTGTPVAAPSKSPTKAPTDTPVAAPSKSPTKAPTGTPVAAPTKSPTNSDCPAGEKMLEVDVSTDSYPGETTWDIKSVCDGGSTVLSGGPYSIAGSTNSVMACVPEGSYTFEIKDSYGDGICCSYGQGAYTVKYGGAQVSSGGDFGRSKADTFGDECSSSKCPAGENPLTVTVNTDNYPRETSWELRTCSGSVAFSGSGYTSAGSTYSTSECVPDTSSYNFVIKDSWGDGICCSYGLGSYTVEFGGAIVASGGAFGSEESKSIGSASCGNIPPNQPEPDCNDITQKNVCRGADTCTWNGNGNNGNCVKAPKPQDPAPQPKCEMCRATGLSCCGTCVFSGPKANRGCFA